MNPYKASAITLCSLLALTGCPSDDTAGESDTTDTDPTTGPTTGVTTPGTDTVDETDTIDETDTDTIGDTDTDTIGDTDTDTASDGALVRVVHGSPGAPNVDIWVMGDDAPVIEDLAYGEASDYLDVPAGEYFFEVRAAGDAGDVAPVYTTDALTLATGDSITAIAAGQVGGEDEAAFRVLALADGFGDPGEGTLVRIVHAGSDAPAVDIDLGNDGEVELEGVDRYADSGPEGVALAAGEALQVGILAAGEPVTAFTTPPIPAGAAVYVIATGLLADLPREDSGFSLLAIGPTGAIGFIDQNPRVYALHAGPDAPAVDICVDGAPLLSNVPYGAMGGIQVPPSTYTLDIYASVDGEECPGDAVGSFETPALAPGDQYLAIATGELTPEEMEAALSVEFYTEEFALDNAETEAVAKIIHAASAPAVNVGTVADTDTAAILGADVIVTGLAQPSETMENLLIEPDSIVVGIGSAADNRPPYSVLANFELPTPDGFRGWVIATGDLSPEGDPEEAGFALHVVSTGATAWELIGPVAGVVPPQ